MAGGAQVSLMRETDSEADTRATTLLHPQVRNQFPDQGSINGPIQAELEFCD